jgi:PHD/YefM family antitoxin component YafN of YafNO toxin-antitoxin module
MLTVNPQYIKDAKGNKALVVLTAKEFNALMEELDELDDIRLYDNAKKEDTGERITLSDYLKTRKKQKHA